MLKWYSLKMGCLASISGPIDIPEFLHVKTNLTGSFRTNRNSEAGNEKKNFNGGLT